LIATSYQRAYGVPTADLFEAAYATGIDTLFPNTTPLATLFANGRFPQTFLFNSTAPVMADIPGTTPGPVTTALLALFPTITPPLAVPPITAGQAAIFALGFGPTLTNPQTNLVKNSYRAGYLADVLTNPDGAVPGLGTNGLLAATPAHPLRIAFKLNDMRTWVPATAPVLLCGGHQDPTVFYANTQVMQAFWGPQLPVQLPLTVIDVDPVPNPPVGPLQNGFATAVNATSTAAFNTAFNADIAAGFTVPDATAAATAAAQSAVVQNYHGTLVPPFCAAAVRGFFANF
ncbi:MAG TPA: hypothetical protein VK572_03980, partial [Burkholderiales bacterium]|nr:hypothetical protein [Burkholderiales bacterium]